MARFYFQGFDGKWYVADDHTTSMLEVLQRRMDGAYKRIMDKEAKVRELCDDVVSRQAVLDITWEEPSYTDALNVLTEIRDKVKALPSVRPQEPKTGHCIIEVRNNKEHHTCSSCQHVVDYEPCYHYCPYCGARMVEPQERSDKE